MSEYTSEYAQEVKQDKTGALDGPACHVCGAIMVPHQNTLNGEVIFKFWRCLSCGTTTGCS